MKRQRSGDRRPHRHRPQPQPHGGGVSVGGRHVASAALAAGRLRRLYCSEPRTAAELGLAQGQSEVWPADKLRDRFGPEFYQGLTAIVEPPPPVEIDLLIDTALAENRVILALEEVQDPQNVGSIFRAAAAFGAAGVVVSKHRAAPMSAALLRASVGYAFTVPFAEVGGFPNWLASLQNFNRIATVAIGGDRPDRIDLSGPAVLVLGSEGDGLKRLTGERCDARLTIPLANVESLNVAQTAVALLYEAARQRGFR